MLLCLFRKGYSFKQLPSSLRLLRHELPAVSCKLLALLHPSLNVIWSFLGLYGSLSYFILKGSYREELAVVVVETLFNISPSYMSDPEQVPCAWHHTVNQQRK